MKNLGEYYDLYVQGDTLLIIWAWSCNNSFSSWSMSSSCKNDKRKVKSFNWYWQVEKGLDKECSFWKNYGEFEKI